MTELLEDSAASRQMEIAQEMVAMSEAAREAFRKQGWKKLPAHRGFYRLAVNLERDKEYKEAVRVSRRAKSEGWKGDWDKRIERCKLKMDRQKD